MKQLELELVEQPDELAYDDDLECQRLIAERGQMTLSEISDHVGLCIERIREIELEATEKMRCGLLIEDLCGPDKSQHVLRRLRGQPVEAYQCELARLRKADEAGKSTRLLERRVTAAGLRMAIGLLDVDGRDGGECLPALLAMGSSPGRHDGRRGLDAQESLEWYAGQLHEAVQGGLWNSVRFLLSQAERYL